MTAKKDDGAPKSPFEALGLPEDATAEQVSSAFRHLARGHRAHLILTNKDRGHASSAPKDEQMDEKQTSTTSDEKKLEEANTKFAELCKARDKALEIIEKRKEKEKQKEKRQKKLKKQQMRRKKAAAIRKKALEKKANKNTTQEATILSNEMIQGALRDAIRYAALHRDEDFDDNTKDQKKPTILITILSIIFAPVILAFSLITKIFFCSCIKDRENDEQLELYERPMTAAKQKIGAHHEEKGQLRENYKNPGEVNVRTEQVHVEEKSLNKESAQIPTKLDLNDLGENLGPAGKTSAPSTLPNSK